MPVLKTSLHPARGQIEYPAGAFAVLNRPSGATLKAHEDTFTFVVIADEDAAHFAHGVVAVVARGADANLFLIVHINSPLPPTRGGL